MNRPGNQQVVPISFLLDGRSVTAQPQETILQVAQKSGVDIPHLCYSEGLRADGNCRACMVEIEGERVLAPACCRQPTEGMNVQSTSDKALRSQSLVLELLKGEVGPARHSPVSELEYWCESRGLSESRFGGRTQPPADQSHPAIAVNLESCIQCTRCLRACREVQVNDVIGLAYRGARAEHFRLKIVVCHCDWIAHIAPAAHSFLRYDTAVGSSPSLLICRTA